jgi:hypothetical protein
MEWIKLQCTAPHHYKMFALAKALGIPNEAISNDLVALGLMTALWVWAANNCPDGNILKFPPWAIAQYLGYRGDPDQFVQSLMAAGFLDGDGVLHNWDRWIGGDVINQKDKQEKLARKRQQDRERKARQRARAAAAKNSAVMPDDPPIMADDSRNVTDHVTPDVTRDISRDISSDNERDGTAKNKSKSKIETESKTRTPRNPVTPFQEPTTTTTTTTTRARAHDVDKPDDAENGAESGEDNDAVNEYGNGVEPDAADRLAERSVDNVTRDIERDTVPDGAVHESDTAAEDDILHEREAALGAFQERAEREEIREALVNSGLPCSPSAVTDVLWHTHTLRMSGREAVMAIRRAAAAPKPSIQYAKSIMTSWAENGMDLSNAEVRAVNVLFTRDRASAHDPPTIF